MNDEPDSREALMEAELRARALTWARRVRRAGWGLALSGAAVGLAAFALLR